ncbi:MAG: arsenic resistance protein [Planctomycetota bacterium]|nr:arsenic resistance protein [Planctomycetota bacterium]MCX8040690.1 arsenic resistance protein [Planctomycetota bacterium]MDW8373679.1 arsenic resistance protein [Planctomycetota bacterium]
MPLTAEGLERAQGGIYLAALLAGALLGGLWPAAAPFAAAALWPALALLLAAIFVQVPLLAVAAAWRQRRLLAALLLGNFLVLPLAVIALAAPLADPALRLGVLLVLLPPCTDWFISFCRQGGGDTAAAIAVAPLLLLVQLLLLPLYLALAGAPLPAALAPGAVLAALLVIALPLAVAGLGEAAGWQPRLRARAAWVPVPALALVVALIAVAQAPALPAALRALPLLVPLYVAFLVLALAAAWILARLCRLPPAQGRCLAYSFGTRNSFVVLPLAAALPAGWEAAVLAIVVQVFVELLGMIAYLRVVPRLRW